jgi:transposase-like protein
LRILAELEGLGSTVAEVARRHEVSSGLLWRWRWRDSHRRGELVDQPAFLPMRVLAAPEAPATPPRDDAPVEMDPRIEPDGTTLRVSETVGAGGLHRVLAALRQ